MQIKLFSVPVFEGAKALDELNAFLRGHKVLKIDKYLANTAEGPAWCFCLEYLEAGAVSPDTAAGAGKTKIDYRKILDEAKFQLFQRMRQARKRIAEEDAVAPYIVMTDEEFMQLIPLPEIKLESLAKVRGFGEKKMAKYGPRFIQYLTELNQPSP